MTNTQLAITAFLILLAESILQAKYGIERSWPQSIAGMLQGSATVCVFIILQRKWP